MNNQVQLVFSIIIANRPLKDALLETVSCSGGKLINTMYGKGSTKNGLLIDMLGFAPEENKIVIACLIMRDKAEIMFDQLNKKFNFNKPNTGIAFTIPVDGISF